MIIKFKRDVLWLGHDMIRKGELAESLGVKGRCIICLEKGKPGSMVHSCIVRDETRTCCSSTFEVIS